MAEWLDIPAAAEYTGVSTDWLRRQLSNGAHPLPAKRVGGRGRQTGKILINRSDLERWIRDWPDYRDALDTDDIVSDIMDFLREADKDE